jgi:hypothetical protein
LPPTFDPTAPRAFTLGKVNLSGVGGDLSFHVILFHTPDGVFGVPLNDDGARALIDQLSAQVSGIVTARAFPPANGKAHA